MFGDAAINLPGITDHDAHGMGTACARNNGNGADFRYLNEYAYPLNTIGKPEAMRKLLAFCKSRQIYGLGRWGEHCHYNSDVVVDLAMQLASQLMIV